MALLPPRGGTRNFRASQDHKLGRKRSTRTDLSDCVYSNHQTLRWRAPQTPPHLPGRSLESGQRDLLLWSLKREAGSERGFLVTTQAPPTAWPWGLRMDCPAQLQGWISVAP